MRTKTIGLVAAILVVGLLAPAAVAADAQTVGEPTCDYPLTLEADATGETVTLEDEPERVVALAPSDAQTVIEIGAEDRLVGMPQTEYTERLDPPDVPDVTADDGFTTDVEVVVATEPDVVIAASAISAEDVETLREHGLTVYHFEDEASIDDVLAHVAITGQLTGECDGAAATVEWMDDRIAVLESAVEDVEHPLAYYAMPFGWTAGDETFQNELIELAGLENLAVDIGIVGWAEISEEDVVEADPSWIVYEDETGEGTPPIAESVEATTAFQSEQFASVHPNDFNQPAPRIVYAVEQILEDAHPDAHAAVADELQAVDDAREAAAGANGDDAPGEDDATGDDGADDGDEVIPGFGVAVALVAVLTALVALSRRR